MIRPSHHHSPVSPSNTLRSGALVVGSLLAALVVAGCTREEAEPNVAVEMRDAYAASSSLYGYVWSPKQFNDPKNHKTILGLIDSLLGDFHRVELAAPLPMFEPGFRLTLATHQQMLNDIRSRFERGDTEYANWRLRSLSMNCVSCHSRYQVPTDFIGSAPPVEEATFEAEYARAQFLFATRQFDAARDELLRLATTQAALPTGVSDAFRALKLWLVIEVRVKEEFRPAAAALEPIIAKLPAGSDYREALEAWHGELLQLATLPPVAAESAGALLAEAEKLLEDRTVESTEREDDLKMVGRLRASALLHRALLQIPSPDPKIAPEKPKPILKKTGSGKEAHVVDDQLKSKRRATFLLGVSYTRLPVDAFETFQDLYLEQTIREFPGTQEAQSSYLLYQNAVEEQSSGSSGLHLDPDQVKKLRELRNLAFGVEAGVRNDMLSEPAE